MLSVSANHSLCVLSVLSAMENPIKLVEYADSHSKIDKTTSMKVLSSPFYILFNTNLFLSASSDVLQESLDLCHLIVVLF